jgi:Alcohol dehydrogenase GroES-like domain
MGLGRRRRAKSFRYLHLQDGYFSLGADKKPDVGAGRTLPFTLGHEIAGVIERVGSDADPAIVGHRVAVYPWIGCRTCAACRGGEENCAETIAISVSPSMAASPFTFWFRISVICSTTRRCRRISPDP